jgi:hypothetical protein
MNFKRTRSVVHRKFNVPAPRGYIGTDEVHKQYLIETTHVLGMRFKRVIDEEEVPLHALIAGGATGNYGWQSKFVEYI